MNRLSKFEDQIVKVTFPKHRTNVSYISASFKTILQNLRSSGQLFTLRCYIQTKNHNFNSEKDFLHEVTPE